jgi:arylesterase/paraoxonase
VIRTQRLRFFSTTDRIVDNLSIDTNGALWAAGFSASLSWLSAYHDPEKVAPSSALRITKNTGNQAFFGEKLKIEKVRHITLKRVKEQCHIIRGYVFEYDGTQASAITSVVHDTRHNLLFLSGKQGRVIGVYSIYSYFPIRSIRDLYNRV